MLCYFSCPSVSGRTLEQNHAAQLLSQMNLKINTYCQCPPPPMPPHVLMDFVVLPPGHGRSVTDF